MPLAASSIEPVPTSPVISARVVDVRVSGLHYFEMQSQRRNPAKYEWRGYIPRGAVKAELTKTGNEYEGLPVPDRLIRERDGVNNQAERMAGEKPPCYALAVDDLEAVSLVIAIPLGKCSQTQLRRPVGENVLRAAIDVIGETSCPHSLRIKTLHVLPTPQPLARDRHGRGDVIRTPQIYDSTLAGRKLALETVQLPREVNDVHESEVPRSGLAEPYFSVFFDDQGTLFYFIIHPKEYNRGGLPAPEGIVHAPGYTWVRARRPHSLAHWRREDAAFSREPNGEWERPRFPDSMHLWLSDEDLP